MALTTRISRRSHVLQSTNAEVSTSQTQAPYYTFVVDGELTIPIEAQYDSARHIEAEQNMHLAMASVKVAGTSQYRIKLISYDTAGLNPVIHINQVVTFTADNGMITLPFLSSLITQNRTLNLFLTEEVVGTPSFDFSVTLVAEDFATLTPIRNGHIIQNPADALLAQQDKLKFNVSGAGLSLSITDDPGNDRTIVQYTSNMGFIGQYLESDLTLVQHQTLYGAGWVLADGVTSCSGSTYGTITGRTVVPDARGLFLRGKNNGRSDGNENPDGELALGAYQADQFSSHVHGITGVGVGAQLPGSYLDGTTTTNQNSYAAGGNETRAKNITVNIFIKIN